MSPPYKFPDETPTGGHHLVRLQLTQARTYWIEADWDAAEGAWFDPLNGGPIEDPVTHFTALPVITPKTQAAAQAAARAALMEALAAAHGLDREAKAIG